MDEPTYDFKTRLREAMTKANMSASQLAERSGCTNAAISRTLSGKNRDVLSSTLLRFAQALHCNPLWLMGASDNYQLDANPQPSPELTKQGYEHILYECRVGDDPKDGINVVYIPQLEVPAIAYSNDFFVSYKVKVEDCKRVRLKDDHMAPIIQSGDVILIDTAFTTINAGQIYAIYSPEIGVRACRISKFLIGGLKIKYENPAYPDEDIERDQLKTIVILGRVLERSGAIV